MTNEERSSLTVKLSDIKPIEGKSVIKIFQEIWPWKRGLVSGNILGQALVWLTMVEIVVLLVCSLAPPRQWGAAITTFLAWLGVLLVAWLLSSNGLIRFFDPARRALNRSDWPKFLDRVRDYNRSLAKIQAAEDSLVVGIDAEEYQRIYDRFVKLLRWRFEDVDNIADQLRGARKVWERKQSRRLVHDSMDSMSAEACLKEDKK